MRARIDKHVRQEMRNHAAHSTGRKAAAIAAYGCLAFAFMAIISKSMPLTVIGLCLLLVLAIFFPRVLKYESKYFFALAMVKRQQAIIREIERILEADDEQLSEILPNKIQFAGVDIEIKIENLEKVRMDLSSRLVDLQSEIKKIEFPSKPGWYKFLQKIFFIKFGEDNVT